MSPQIAATLNTIKLVEQNVRAELRDLEMEQVRLVSQLRINAEQYVRAMMHCAVADALSDGEAR